MSGKVLKIKKEVYIERHENGLYCQYTSLIKSALCIVSPGLLSIRTQAELKEMYDNAKQNVKEGGSK